MGQFRQILILGMGVNYAPRLAAILERQSSITFVSKLAQIARKVSGRLGARLLTVKEAWYLTPNMIRVIFAGPELHGFPAGREGGNCKLMISVAGEAKASFAERLKNAMNAGPSS